MLAHLVLALALTLQQAEATPQPPAPPPQAAPAAPAPPAPPAPRPPRAPAAKAPKGPPPDAAAAPRDEPILVGFDKASGRRFSGDFEEADVDDALRQLAEAADWSVVLPHGESGTVSAHFKNVPVEDALRAICQQAGLTAVREGAIVTFRERSRLPGLSGLTRDLGRDVRRLADEALREADKASRAADREVRRAERRASRGGERGDRVVHGDVVIHAKEPARNVVALRGSIKVEPGAEVQDAVAVLGSVLLEPGARAHQVVAVGGSVKLGAGAEVEQDAVSVGGDVEKDPGATVGGEEVGVGVPALSSVAAMLGSRMAFGERESGAFKVFQVLAKFVVFFALGLIVLALFPRRLDVVASSFTARPLASVLAGLLGMLVVPILIVLLVATIIGIPLVPVAVLLLLAAGILGFTALAFYLGRALPLRTARATSVLQLAIGTALIVLVTSIPILGGMAWVAAALLTFGAVLRSRFGSQGGPVLPTTAAPPPPAGPPPAPPPAAA